MTDCELKTALREMDSWLTWNSSPSYLPHTKNIPLIARHAGSSIWIMLWYDLHSNPYIYYTCSKLILFNTHNKCLGLFLPTHCGAGSVKVNYYRCMRKIWGLVKPHKVNKLQMRLSYCRIYFNTVCNMKNTNNLTQIKLLQAKIVFRIHTQWSL